MPTYQYACTECGHRFEAVQSFTDDSLTTCPVCSGQLRKVYGSVGVVFKGSGFYRTDSREKSKTGSNGAGEKPGDKVAAKADKAASEKKADTPAKAGAAASSTGGGPGGGSAAGGSSAGGGSAGGSRAAAV